MDDDRGLTDSHVTDRGKSDVAGPMRVTAENYEIPMATPYKRILPKLWSDNFNVNKKPRPTLEVEQKKMFNYETRVTNRIVYTKWQLDEMEKVFSVQPYPDTNYLKQLSTKLDIPLKKLRNWFQNKRTKLKKRDLFRNHPVRNCDLSLWTPRRRASTSIPMTRICAASAPIKNNVLLVYSDMYSKPRMVSRKIGQNTYVQHNQTNVNLTTNFQNFPPNAGLVCKQPINNTSHYANSGYFPLYVSNYGSPLAYNNNQFHWRSNVDRAPISNPTLSQYYNSLTQARLGAYYMQLQNVMNQVQNNRNTYHTLINVNLESKNPRNIGQYTGSLNVPEVSNAGINSPHIFGSWTKQDMSNNVVPCLFGPSALSRNHVVPFCEKTNLDTRFEMFPGRKASVVSSSVDVASNFSGVDFQENDANADQKVGGHMWQSGLSLCSKTTTNEQSARSIPLMSYNSIPLHRQPYPISLCRAPPIGDHKNCLSVNKFSSSQTTTNSANQDEVLVSHTGSYSSQTNYDKPVLAYESTPTKLTNKEASMTQALKSTDFKKNPVLCDTSEQQLSDDDGFSSIPDSPDFTTCDSSSDEQSSSNSWSFKSNRQLCLESSYDGFEFLDVNQNRFDNSYSSETGCSNVYNDSGIGMENGCPLKKSVTDFNLSFSSQEKTPGSKYPYNFYASQETHLSGNKPPCFNSCEKMTAVDYSTYGQFAKTSDGNLYSYQENDACSWNNVSSSVMTQETPCNNTLSPDNVENSKRKIKENKAFEQNFSEQERQADIEQPDSSSQGIPCVQKGGISDINQPESISQFSAIPINYTKTLNEDEAMGDSSNDDGEDEDSEMSSSDETSDSSENTNEDEIESICSKEGISCEESPNKIKEVAKESLKQGRRSKIKDYDYILEYSCHSNMEVQSHRRTDDGKVKQSLSGSSNMLAWTCPSQTVSNSSDMLAQSTVTSKLPSISSICHMDCRRTCAKNNDVDRKGYLISTSGHNYSVFRNFPSYSCPDSHSNDRSQHHIVPITSASSYYKNAVTFGKADQNTPTCSESNPGS